MIASRDRIAPHGGSLVKRWATVSEAKEIAHEALGWRSVTLDRRAQSDLELIASGAYSPLSGFMGRDDFDCVLHRSRLASGEVWTIPVVLPVDGARAAHFPERGPVALRDEGGTLLGVLDLEEKVVCDHQVWAQRVYGTNDPAHPGVRKIREGGEWLLGGPVKVVRRPGKIQFPAYHLDPDETRKIIRERGWRTVVGFQTRNPIHRAHEFILKTALEIHDALFIQPLVGETLPADIPAAVRLRCYEALIEEYYPKDRTLLAVLPAVMRFAGPREAIFHAIIRKNYGCTHFIVGRDHAGAAGYYGPYDAQRIFDEFAPEEIGIAPLRFEESFYCRRCEGMASLKTCPHPEGARLILSGTAVRGMLQRREPPPAEFTRPEVARILLETFAGDAP